MLCCSICRTYNNQLRRIKVNNKIILICNTCENELGYENKPTNEVDELTSFLNNEKNSVLKSVVVESENNSKYLLFEDNFSNTINRNDLKIIADQIYKTLELGNSLDKFIAGRNIRKYFEKHYSYSPIEREKFEVPYEKLGIKKRCFNSDKNKWGFKCGNCSRLINIDEQDFYYTIIPSYLFNAKSERACSKDCTKVIAEDIVKNWLNTQNKIEYFYTDDLEDKIIAQIEDD